MMEEESVSTFAAVILLSFNILYIRDCNTLAKYSETSQHPRPVLVILYCASDAIKTLLMEDNYHIPAVKGTFHQKKGNQSHFYWLKTEIVLTPITTRMN